MEEQTGQFASVMCTDEGHESDDSEQQHDAFAENTILLPEVKEIDGAVELVEEPPLELSTNSVDVLSEGLNDSDKLIEVARIEVKPIKDIIDRIEPNIVDDVKKTVRSLERRSARNISTNAVKREKTPPTPPVVKKTPGRRGRKPKNPPPVEIEEDNRPLIEMVNIPAIKTQTFEQPLDIKEELDDKDEREESNIDEHQCRICLSKSHLSSIFLFEDTATIADKIMTICTNIKILEKDFLPQFICNTCAQTVNVAFNFKSLCEKTDEDLRSKLKRSKKKIRRPTEFVLIDCKDISEESEEDVKVKDDDEFHISHESEHSGQESDSDSSFEILKKKNRKTVRRRRSAGVRRRGRLPGSTNPAKRTRLNKPDENCSTLNPTTGEVKENVDAEEKNFSTEEEHTPPKKRRSRGRPKTEDGNTTQDNSRRKEHLCVYCNKVFGTAVLLREHKKSHAGEKPFSCPICSKPFKLLGSLNSHIRKHKEEDNLMCTQCDKHFPNKTEHRKHMVEVHNEPAASFVCDKCKRAFTTKPRLDRHQENKCPGFETTSIKKPKPELDAIALGRDLFKCVAPMTTTYWSDSFSD